MSKKRKYKGAFISAEEINQQKLEVERSKEFSKRSGGDCHRRRVQMVTLKLLNGRRRH